MAALLLLLLAVALMWPIPRWLAGQAPLRRSPRAALVLWQSVSLAGVLAALAAAPAAIPGLTGDHATPVLRSLILAGAVVVTGVVLVRLLRSGHVVGTRLRSLRRAHRELVDLIGTPEATLGPDGRVLDHPTPTAYCLPGLRHRVVLSRGTLTLLSSTELAAVLAHERAHLTRRHDLVLEFFTVLHTAAPPRVRSAAGLDEVRLLVEALADRAAVRQEGPLPLARALVTLADHKAPEAGIAANATGAAARLRLLTQPAPTWQAPALYAVSALVVVLPVALLVLAWRQ